MNSVPALVLIPIILLFLPLSLPSMIEAQPSQSGNISTNAFRSTTLQKGEISPFRWSDTDGIVAAHAYELGLGEDLQRILLGYANRTGITDLCRYVTKSRGQLDPGEDQSHKLLDNGEYYLQRPSSSPNWKSNLHWLSPINDSDESSINAFDGFLQALSLAGFDDILDSIGRQLKLDGLVIFSATFITVSYAKGGGTLHEDVRDTDGKTFNIIIPLLSDQGGGALDIQGDGNRSIEASERRIGTYMYRKNYAVMIGDGVMHGTSPTARDGFRLAATLYITDVNADNLNRIADNASEHYAEQDPEWLMEIAGTHWSSKDPSKKLPKPDISSFIQQYS